MLPAFCTATTPSPMVARPAVLPLIAPEFAACTQPPAEAPRSTPARGGFDAAGAPDRDALAAAAEAAGLRVAFDDTWSDVFSRVIVEKVEPHLGIGRATVLCEYPVVEAALARFPGRAP